MENIPLIKAKVCIIGDTAVGKTCIINRTISNSFSENVKPTVAENYTYTYQKNQCNIEFGIWDTAGQDSFRSLVPMFWQKANVIIIVYDITNRNTFDSLKDHWIDSLSESVFDSTVILLVGNKLDLRDERVVDFAKADDFSRFNNIAQYFEVSAKTGEGIDAIWDFIANAPEIQSITPEESIQPPAPELSPDPNTSPGIVSTAFNYLKRFYQYIKSFFF